MEIRPNPIAFAAQWICKLQWHVCTNTYLHIYELKQQEHHTDWSETKIKSSNLHIIHFSFYSDIRNVNPVTSNVRLLLMFYSQLPRACHKSTVNKHYLLGLCLLYADNSSGIRSSISTLHSQCVGLYYIHWVIVQIEVLQILFCWFFLNPLSKYLNGHPWSSLTKRMKYENKLEERNVFLVDYQIVWFHTQRSLSIVASTINLFQPVTHI